MLGHLTDEQIIRVLKENALGRIGCSDGGTTYVVPINYYYDGKAIIMHSHMGKKIEMMRQNPHVCFEVDELQSFTNWKSVIAWGRYEEVVNEEEQRGIIDAFVNSLLRIKPSETALLPELYDVRLHPRSEPAKTIVYKIVIERMTGRYESNEE
jgi:uncharacterized protein